MSIICCGVLQYLLGGVRRANGWLEMAKTRPHFPPTDSKEVLSVGCLLTVLHQTLQDPHPLQVSLPWNLRHLRGLLIALKC